MLASQLRERTGMLTGTRRPELRSVPGFFGIFITTAIIYYLKNFVNRFWAFFLFFIQLIRLSFLNQTICLLA
jgi:hypothetical protein